MAKIAGITIELGADTSGIEKGLKNVDKSLKSTQSALKDVNKLLKLDPTNTELLKQKQQLLRDAVSQTRDRLEKLKEAQAQMDASGVDKNSAQYQALQREIIKTEQDLKSATDAANKFHPALEKIKASAEKASDGLKKAQAQTKALSTAAGAAITTLAGMGYAAVTGADDLNTLSKQTGFTTAEIQKMKYAADLVDVSFEDIAGALKKFKSKIDPSNKSLQELGVSVTDADGNLRAATDVFKDAVTALSKIENETERDQKSMELFGKSADSLAGIIDDGGAALEEYGKQAEELGLILDQDTLDALNETNDTIDQMKAQVTGIVAVVGSKVVPVVAPILEQVGTMVAGVAEQVSKISPETMKVILAILALVAAISPLLGLLSAVATAIAFLASPIGIAIAAIAAIIAFAVLLIKNWDKVEAKADELAAKVKEAWDSMKAKVVAAASNILTRTRNSWNNIKTAITTPINAARDAVTKAVDTIKSIFPIKLGNIFSGLKLPHFKISGGKAPWGILGEGEAPKIDIEWYRKARHAPYLLDGATIFGAMGGKLLGGGEAGKEVILSYDKLAGMGGTTNVVINVTAAPGMDVNALADKIQQKFVRASNMRRAAHA